jgi:hypothetical protein
MGVAAADGEPASVGGQPGGKMIVAGLQVAVQDFDSGKTGLEPVEVIGHASSGQSREDVVDAEKHLLLLEISHQAGKVISPALNLYVLPFRNVVNAHVDFVPTGRSTRNLLTHEKVRVPPKTLPSLDRIVIGNRDQIQPQLLELFVEGFGGAIALAAKTSQHRHSRHAGVDGVDV